MLDSKEHAARIPCLDGLRAISILFVLVWHLDGTRNAPSLELHRIVDFGNFGVRVFFVISGYLITRLLLAELAKTGRISLPMFYFRRTFRIMPAFYGVVLLLALADQLGWFELRDGDVLHGMTFTMNYHQERAWEVGHLWSIAVEEQFYLLWPALMLLLRPRRALLVALFAVVLAPSVRVATWVLLPESRAGIGESFQTVADALASGCALAIAKPQLDSLGWFPRLQSRAATPLVLFAFALVCEHFHTYVSFGYTVGETLNNVALSLLVDAVIRNPATPFARFLELRPLVFLGTLSYSLYLVQQPLLYRDSSAWFTAFPLNIVLVFGFALASHYLVERPFLDLRLRISRRWRFAGQPTEMPMPALGAHEPIQALVSPLPIRVRSLAD